MENKPEVFKVSGCGVTFICNNREEVKARVLEIIDRGGVPEVQRWMEAI
jgi:hypothetical protein